jgi:ABC-type polysaccharide/polyol phosphate transport system ATPase subunit
MLPAMVGPHAAIEVRGLRKTFRTPRHHVHTLKERALHPFQRTQYDERTILHDVDFDVLAGEFFGIVGRNGSGKSTLLKCLAGIYRADAGTIRIAGRLSPFIELGVGFNPDLTAYDNVVLNAVMMGLSPAQARARFDDVLAFAELEDFVDLKLKNYSSGMQVRLAFSVMVQTEADVLLIDEVLAVGDAAFQQKCFDVFYDLREQGTTIVLVTHAMPLVEQFCHRAMLVGPGGIEAIGDPEEVGRRYLQANFAQGQQHTDFGDGAPAPIRLVDLWTSDASDERASSVAHGGPLRVHAVFEADADIEAPGIALWIENDDRVKICSVGAREEGAPLAPIARGERVEVMAEIANAFTSGRYYVGCSVSSGTSGAQVLLFLERAVDFYVYGGEAIHGLVSIGHWSEVRRSHTAVAP